MNRWSLKWKPNALRELAAIWNLSKEKTVITQTVHRLEQEILRNPMSTGESRSGLQRMAFASPLCINYEVVPDDHKVVVISIRQF